MLSPDGPVVVEWTNASLGPAAADVAESWIVGATNTVDGGFASSSGRTSRSASRYWATIGTIAIASGSASSWPASRVDRS
jgi:hypothetical protein